MFLEFLCRLGLKHWIKGPLNSNQLIGGIEKLQKYLETLQFGKTIQRNEFLH